SSSSGSSTNTSSTSSTTTTTTTTTTTSTGRLAVPQISVYSGMPDRQTVQVFQQALHRQPNTAAQYLQQMYAAQQQHLMLQTAALQQHHSLSTAQLQSLAAVQQVNTTSGRNARTIAVLVWLASNAKFTALSRCPTQASITAGRQSSSQNGTSAQQTGSTQATVGAASTRNLYTLQAQMYLRAQMLIFTPTATVTAVQSESSTQASSLVPTLTLNQVQNLTIRGQQVATTSSSQTQSLQALSLKQTPVPIQPASVMKNPTQGASAGAKAGSAENSSDGGKKGDNAALTEVRAINMSRNVNAVSARPLIAPASLSSPNCTVFLLGSGGAPAKRPSASPETPPPAMTSGTASEAPAVTGSTPQNGENKPPQAIVKPQVLTHVIEGFVIQEGAEPFPVCVEHLPILIDSPKKLDHQLSSDPDNTPASNAANSDSETDDISQPEKEQEPKLTCEYCGWVDFAYTFKGSKRFCSVVCAKRQYNVGCTKRMGLFHPEKNKQVSNWRRKSQGRASIEAKKQKLSLSPQQTQGSSVSSPHASQPSQEESSLCSDMSSCEEPPSPLSAASSGALAPPPAPPQVPAHRRPGRASDQEGCSEREAALLRQRFVPNDPTKWNVEEVYDFIRSLPGCQEIADEFRSQEIDGQALLLLKEDHLMSTMNIKLGPALKIFARINMLKDS
ncbi:unnamed protein product, partial [Tetraodon nigroviridis]